MLGDKVIQDNNAAFDDAPLLSRVNIFPSLRHIPRKVFHHIGARCTRMLGNVRRRLFNAFAMMVFKPRHTFAPIGAYFAMGMQQPRNTQVTHLLQVRKIHAHGIDDPQAQAQTGRDGEQDVVAGKQQARPTVEKREVAGRVARGIDDLELRLPHYNNVAFCNEFQVAPLGLEAGNAHAVTSRFMHKVAIEPLGAYLGFGDAQVFDVA